MKPLASAIVMLTLLLSGCGAPETAAEGDGTWVGTITTEGNVTTVVNESGSVWGGPATLVEEASIGVESGADEYLLGRVMGLTASDRRILVVDSQVPALRVYDWNGGYLNDLGREGQGPGEYRYPTSVGVDGLGRVWLHEPLAARIIVFEPSGILAATLTVDGARGFFMNSMVLSADGEAHVVAFVRPEEPTTGQSSSRRARRPYDIDGAPGDPVLMPSLGDGLVDSGILEARAGDTTRGAAVPFYARTVTEFAPSLAVLVGVGTRYRFEIRQVDGTRLLVERSSDPVAVFPDEAEAHKRAVLRYLRDMEPGWVWKGPPIPTTKPAFSRFVPAASGETWVVRRGPASLDSECDEASFELDGVAHCWPEQRFVDVFAADGRYLGLVDVPPGFSMEPLPFIHGSDVIARVEDEAGTIMVKRYRLVLPGEEEQ